MTIDAGINNVKFLPTRSLPVLCFVGHGRAGKDTAGEYLRDRYGLRFVGSSSWAMRFYVAEKLGIPVGEAWDSRHERRLEWKKILDDFREAHGHAACIRCVLRENDVVVGLRDFKELVAGRAAGLLDLIVWIENPRVYADPTVQFTQSDCDITVLNDASYEAFYARLDRLATAIGLKRAVTPIKFDALEQLTRANY